MIAVVYKDEAAITHILFKILTSSLVNSTSYGH